MLVSLPVFTSCFSPWTGKSKEDSRNTDTPVTYTVTFNTAGGSPAPAPAVVTSGGKVTEPPAMTKTGYTFDGWYREADFVNKWNFASDTVTGNITLYAKWVLVEMVWIASGTFQMGDTGLPVATPVHPVTISKGFYMGKYEVTQAQYEEVMGNNPSSFTTDAAEGEIQANRPIEGVSWYDAVEFCNKLSTKEGLTPYYTIDKTVGSDTNNKNNFDTLKYLVTGNIAANGYRLPTEAEWEYTARGGNLSPGNYTYSGSDNADEVAWTDDNSEGRTHDVGTKAPNSLGIYNMSGNVWEWCWDWKGNYPSGAQIDPAGASSGSDRVVRGGSWYNSAGSARSANRYFNIPSFRGFNLGFRLVRP